MGFPHWLFHCQPCWQSVTLGFLKRKAQTTVLHSGGDGPSLLEEGHCMPAPEEEKWVEVGDPHIRSWRTLR